MKLRITVEGVAYDVEVEVLEGMESEVAAPVAPRAAAPQPIAPAAPAKPAPAPAAPAAKVAGSDNVLKAPVASTVIKIHVKEGDKVGANQKMFTVEAMKMETDVVSVAAGTVKSILVNEGDAVKQGQPLLEYV